MATRSRPPATSRTATLLADSSQASVARPRGEIQHRYGRLVPNQAL